jgi:Holliday junction resolvase-like predicted endonuclease
VVTNEQKRKSIKAARLYLEMRGHKLMEQSWSAGKHRIDLIATKDNVVEFIEVNYARDDEAIANNETAAKIKARNEAAETWIEQNKYKGQNNFMSIEIYGSSYTILGVNQL